VRRIQEGLAHSVAVSQLLTRHGAKNYLYNPVAVNLGHAIAVIRHLLHAITTSNSPGVDIRRGGLWYGIFDSAE
jgi:hypothetical protein